jgi:hypothetical protein
MYRRYIALVPLIFCLNSQAFEQKVTCMNQLEVKVTSKEKTRKFSFFETFSFNNTETIVTGRIEIYNPTEISKDFSTKMLKAKFNDAQPVRSYKKGAETNVVDFQNGVQIPSQTTRVYNAVWYPNLPAGIKLTSAEFSCY